MSTTKDSKYHECYECYRDNGEGSECYDCTCEQEYDSDTGEIYSSTCDWCVEKHTIHALLNETDKATGTERLTRISALFAYLRTIPDFIRVHAFFRQALIAKVAEFSSDSNLAATIAEMKSFLDTLISDI